MIGIKNIGIYLPKNSRSNYSRMEEFSIDEEFIKEKIGIESVTLLEEGWDTSDLCVAAFGELKKREGDNLEDIEALVVVSQNPDYGLPHTSAIVHSKLELPKECACFDVSLGCSGFVYGLSILKNFMTGNGMKKAVLITADPYSKVIDKEDKHTSLLFGDGATATLLSDEPIFDIGKFTFGTIGSKYESLIVKDGVLSMSGRSIFNFASVEVPKDVEKVLEVNKIVIDEVDKFILHPGSKYVVDSIAKRSGVDSEKILSDNSQYGNTVSSSIPMLLCGEIDKNDELILLSGFGVGLSWSSVIIRRVKK